MMQDRTYIGNAPMVLSIPPPTGRKINVKAVRALGIIELILGAVAFCLGIAILSYMNYKIIRLGCGIWSGIFITIAGILSVFSSQNTANRCLIGTTLAFNVVACSAAFIDLGMSSIGLYSLECRYYSYNIDMFQEYHSCRRSSVIAMYATIVGVMVIEFFVALSSSIFFCIGCCCTAQTLLPTSMTTPGTVLQERLCLAPSGQQVMASTAHSGYPPANQSIILPVVSGNQLAAGTYWTGSQPYNPLANEMAINSTNIAFSTQQNHDKAVLIDNSNDVDGFPA